MLAATSNHLKIDRHNNAYGNGSQREGHFVLMFDRQRVTQKVRSVGCRSAADC
ncbi:hypothetical protein [Microbulbifer sp. THAF38]|uniref:hypothetical protein n=1 Tax=Microbulbifer sp. THAF38 TaxID=2587856 RepID=UPI0012A972F0|nr:hypothetical protein [Microbulbifer sp. THAF38]QFT54471.1 hypothetical protein FIU95_07890 [Microbulbifer sp. THAF38]